MGKETTDIAGLLERLEINDPTCSALQGELDKAGFTIFECVEDKGYVSWKPPNTKSPSYKSLSNITSAHEIQKHIDHDGNSPAKLVCVSNIRLPQYFENLPPEEYANKFPYGQHEIGSLHVAVKNRGVDLKNDIDFVFGGSTLEMLATSSNENPYLLTRIPGTKAIIITKQKEYVADFSSLGFQFERLVTGKQLDDCSEAVDSVDHMQIMKVGKYRVLFLAEADAADEDGSPIEVKASNPRYWGTKVMFQMISSGSKKLCHGVKSRGRLVGIDIKPLSSVSQEAFSGCYKSIKDLESAIVAGMDKMYSEMMSEGQNGDADCETFKIYFTVNSLTLLPMRGRNSRNLLPPSDIVRELLG